MLKKHTSPPFPQALHGKKGIRNASEILEVLRQVKVNIPLLDMIKQVPTYAKFLKDLCTIKRGLNVNKKAFLTEQVSAIIQCKSPLKYKDPGCPTISVMIGGKVVEKALLDLGASVNLLPYSVYKQLGLVDFVVLDTDPLSRKNYVPIILGRPFLATSNAIINCRNGLMQLTFGNMTLELNIFYMSKKLITPEEEKGPEEEEEEILPLFNKEEAQEAAKEETPKLNLKPLPMELKYTYLEENKQCPVVISSSLTTPQEISLLEVLKRCKKAIGWQISDLKGISPLVCTHHIYMEEEAKPIRQPQRRLNPHLQKVVQAEVLKLLQAGIIYPISDSPWVSPTQVVPKKSGITVVQNEKEKNCYTPHFRVPKAIISDGGTHFCNRLFETLLAKYGVKHKVATPYHPQTFGQVELANREIKNILMKSRAKRCLDLNEMEELRNDAYINSKVAKQRMKRWHDQLISNKEFRKGQRVLLYDSRLHIFLGKLKSRWIDPFIIHQVHLNGVVELLNSNSTDTFKVNGHRLKPFKQEKEEINLLEP
ncbi:hypothetical protein CK203_049351 [Vitis vinifera]|uniref:Integrase catalytic domain-containing protein n=1 Tax=Vitis vinifera TaxID=29760 RepID=A0A438FVN4_VITVI|nr:hypothetical protein CK203_049351 [Vitis vinifera]